MGLVIERRFIELSSPSCEFSSPSFSPSTCLEVEQLRDALWITFILCGFRSKKIIDSGALDDFSIRLQPGMDYFVLGTIIFFTSESLFFDPESTTEAVVGVGVCLYIGVGRTN